MEYVAYDWTQPFSTVIIFNTNAYQNESYSREALTRWNCSFLDCCFYQISLTMQSLHLALFRTILHSKSLPQNELLAFVHTHRDNQQSMTFSE